MKKETLFDKQNRYRKVSDNLIESSQTIGLLMSFLTALNLFVLAFLLNERYFVLIPLALIFLIPTILMFVSFIYDRKKTKITDAVLDGKIDYKEYHGVEDILELVGEK